MIKRFSLLLLLATLTLAPAVAQDSLREGFLNPPKEAKVRVWWHWMNANITKEGITKDLQWMDRAGVAGFHNFDAGLDTPQIVEKRLPYMSPEWKEAFNHSIDIADSLGMEVTIASSPGWSETGGPWVSMDDAMKKLCWRTMVIEGGNTFKGALPEPIRRCGDYQDLDPKWNTQAHTPEHENYYRDAAVVAVRLPDADRSMEEMGAVTTRREIEGADCHLVEFPEPRLIKAVRLTWGEEDRGKYARTLEYSDDGICYNTILAELPDERSACKAIDFTPVKARFFRLRNLVKGEKMDLLGFELSPVTLVCMDSEKAGFFAGAAVRELYPTPPTEDAVPLSDIVDLTSRFRSGVLTWRVPEGRWRIYRFGYNLIGKKNHPASPEATGLEVDKLDKEAVHRYYRHYLGMYDEASKGRMGKVITHIMIDSYEAHPQTWTASMPQQFKKSRGYDLIKWMPALTGQIIESSEATEEFLAQWRQTLGELMTECHYEGASDILKEYGMKRYTESHEAYRAYVVDGMDPKRYADIPMGAFWTKTGFYSSYPSAEADIRESASVAHIYGQNICASESFTTDGISNERSKRAWASSPASLKPHADAAMASGLNRFVIHCSAHQPVEDRIPGLGLGRYGQWFNRHDTWAEEARVWTDYLSRSSYMLQQGRYVADIAYFYGETLNLTARFKDSRARIPEGYSFDFINRDVILNLLKVKDGRLVTDSGMCYSVLVVDDEVVYISKEVRARLEEFKAAGVPVVGVDDCEKALKEKGIAPDLLILPRTGADLRFVHRSLKDCDIYWIANISPEYRSLDVTLRADGRKPQLWHADSGTIEDADYICEEGRTVVHLDFVPDDALFIVLRGQAEKGGKHSPRRMEHKVLSLDGSWDVTFQEGRKAPGKTVFPRLMSYTESPEAGIRYFSGTATYSKTFNFGKVGDECWLDLGEVHEMARVFLNGEDLGLLWKAPYRVRIDKALKEGSNRIEIKVINTWVNRLIGDEQPDAGERVSYTALKFYGKDEALLPAGLMGPVQINSIQ